MDSQTKRRFSRILYEALDQQGYSATRINRRSDMTHELLSKKTTKWGDTCTFVAGSTGEGVSKLYSGDVDLMYILPGIVCVDEYNGEEGLLVVTNEYSRTKPGYVRLRVNSDFQYIEALKKKLCTSMNEEGNVYLNSKGTKLFLGSRQVPFQREINGPAITSLYTCRDVSQMFFPEFIPILSMFENPGTFIETDQVIGLPFYSFTCLDRWLKRERFYEWPSETLQNKIASMIGYVVPVGNKSSQEPDIEWRISYTTAEKELVRNMNSGQVKVYVVLKLVQKERLKPVCKNFTSYMVKNLVFGVLEKSPMSMFTPDTLVDGIMSAFVMLKECLERKTLPCYMIAERNLFAERLGEEDIASLSAEVDKIIQEGYVFLLKNHKVSLSMHLNYFCPDRAASFARWIEEIEDIFFAQMARSNKANFNYLTFRLLQLICPDMVTDMVTDALAGKKIDKAFFIGRFVVRYLNTLKNVLS